MGRSKKAKQKFSIRIPVFAGIQIGIAAFVFLLSASPALAENPFSLTTTPQLAPSLVFEDEGGAEHALSDYRGRFVLLTLWATWCPSCAKEMPALDALQNAFDPQKLVVLPLSEDSETEVVAAFYRLHGVKHLAIALDKTSHAPSALFLRGLPTTLVIDPLGYEIARVEGDTDWTSPKTLLFLRQKIGDN